MNTKNWIILQGARGKHDWATGSDITSGQQQAGIVYSGYVSQSVSLSSDDRSVTMRKRSRHCS